MICHATLEYSSYNNNKLIYILPYGRNFRGSGSTGQFM